MPTTKDALKDYIDNFSTAFLPQMEAYVSEKPFDTEPFNKEPNSALLPSLVWLLARYIAENTPGDLDTRMTVGLQTSCALPEILRQFPLAAKKVR